MVTPEKKSGKNFAARKKVQKKDLTPERLDEIALRYVSRYAASTGMLERVLKRHVQKAGFQNPDFDATPFLEKITQIGKRYVEKGWVDDQGMARRMVEQGKLNGMSRQKITQKLQLRGISTVLIRETFAREGDENDDITAARVFAKRKHLGRHRKNKPDETTFNKEMGKLCRAGFAPALARKVLEETGDED